MTSLEWNSLGDVWDPNKGIDIAEISISEGGRLDIFYCISLLLTILTDWTGWLIQ